MMLGRTILFIAFIMFIWLSIHRKVLMCSILTRCVMSKSAPVSAQAVTCIPPTCF